MTATTRAARAATLFEGIARERMEVEEIKGTIYAFGSELACLRLLAKYHTNGTIHNPKARVSYSPGRQRWFFALDT